MTNQSVEAAAGHGRHPLVGDPRPQRHAGDLPAGHLRARASTDGIHRWMGSIAMDTAGNMALGYSASNASHAPSRARGTPAAWPATRSGTMPQGEGIIINGTGSQTGSQLAGATTPR